MATLRPFLDLREQRKKDGLFPLKISVSVSRSIVFQISMKIFLQEDNWNSQTCRVIRHNSKSLFNMALQERLLSLEKKLTVLELSGQLSNMTVKEVRQYLLASDKIERSVHGELVGYYEQYISRIGNSSTRGTHEHTLKKIQEYARGRLSFKDITKAWLLGFERYLFSQHLDERGRTIPGVRKLTPNGVNLHLRNLRTLFNDAVTFGAAEANWYPFKKYNMPSEEPVKLALPVKDLRIIRDFPAEEFCQRYLDVFMLSFYLIGINIGDLLLLRPSDLVGGRIEFSRQKTKKRYSIKVEPEAMDIINRWRGKKYLLCFMDEREDYRSFLKLMNKHLKEFGHVDVDLANKGKKTKTGLYPFLRSYYARDTWATLASVLDIPEDTIAAALGHGKKSVTKSYISFHMKKVDIANRMVLDFVASNMSEDEIFEVKAAQMYRNMSFARKFAGINQSYMTMQMPMYELGNM
ncbi:site-specific integrase [uncultured Alistipes sp.]|uniref:tyrosine-type recombinase/integrase n=1 Tax=uncultured Alistipes sp. TaxID=538949 RepID=UPI002612FEAC|nr:site-specific integrase [uncultured Alistipes sp.]